MKRTTPLPFALPDIGQAELDEIKEVLESGWITTGPKVHQFEQRFADYLGAKHAIAVNSCTGAMHLALEAIGVQRGDYVVTTPYTFAATAEVIRHLNAIPVFVDVDRDTLNMAPDRLAETIADLKQCLDGGRTPQTVAVARAFRNDPGAASARSRLFSERRRRPALKAVMPVHIAGHPCDMDVISAIAAQHSLAVVEDCAHACSASFKGRPVGGGITHAVPWAACFSFYATKTLTTGEGGMVTTDRQEWADRCRVMSLHGISKDAWKRYTAEGSWYYEINAPGYKYNMSDISAALGLAQLKKVEAMRQRREQIARRFDAAFADNPAIEIPTLRPDVRHAWHLYMLRLNLDQLGIGRDQFIEELKQAQISPSVHFIPLHVHPYYQATYGYDGEDFPVAYREYQREISLPIYSKMTDQDVEDVIDGVSGVVRQFRLESHYAVAGR
jgi:dTDP-4-amino-4,6-dideoxygalactose transaminase